MTPYLNTSACSQTEGQTYLTTMNQDHGCLSTAHFTYHMENEHSLQFQSYNSYTEQMWHSTLAFFFFLVCIAIFFHTRKSVCGDFFLDINTNLCAIFRT